MPLLGALVRLFGAFPVDVRQGEGRAALRGGASCSVEAGSSSGSSRRAVARATGWMEEELRAGAARLALETGAPLVPATIRGAFRAWPHFHALPGLATIRVRYHDPIDPAPYARAAGRGGARRRCSPSCAGAWSAR